VKASVIVPTYNRPGELLLVLRSLARQSRLPDEVVVADDGSGEETRRTVEEFARSPECAFPVRHAWQEDRGFRKPMILNEAVRRSSGDYLVFIDGDCIAHPRFLASHLTLAEPRSILGGRRVELGKALSARLLEREESYPGSLWSLLWDSIAGDTRRVEEAVRMAAPALRKLLHRDRISDNGIWGCNFSIPRALFFEINGCDEEFTDGSIEDNDLGIRVLNGGGRVRSVRALAIVFHLWHAATWGFGSEKYLQNRRILERRIALKEARCLRGIVDLSPGVTREPAGR
jgi:glycosyltransferase involved in cell wall biosynthesis